jgi:tryptophan synthase beta subunit
MKSFLVDDKGFYGEFGEDYIPEILYKCVEDLRRQTTAFFTILMEASGYPRAGRKKRIRW